MRTVLLSLAVVGLIAGATSQASAASLITDGDFSSPSGGSSYTTYNGGSFGPWMVSGSVDLIGGYWQAPSASGGSVDLDGNSPGGISQTFTAPKGEYELTFSLSGNPDGGDPLKTVNVSVGDANQDFTYMTGANNHADMNYATETLKFFNTGTSTLTFASLDGAGSPYGPVVGAVSVSAVPEPAVWAMMLVGFGGLGASMRVSRRRAVVA